MTNELTADEQSVLIIIINFNDWDNTVECLKSLKNLNYSFFDIAVVDNSSGDSSLKSYEEWIRNDYDIQNTLFPELVNTSRTRVFKSYFTSQVSLSNEVDFFNIFYLRVANNGFAAANNYAIRTICSKKYPYYWLLNNDTVVRPDSLYKLVNSANRTDPKIGIIGASIMQYYNKDKLQGIGGRYNKWFGKVAEIGAGKLLNLQTDYSKITFDYVIGASMFVRRGFIESVGYMDEDLFLYYEELDWCLRGRRQKWELLYCPEAVIYHKQGASINKENTQRGNSVISDYYSVRNRLIIAKRYFPHTLITLYPSFIKYIITRLFYGQFDRVSLFFRILFNTTSHFKKNNSDKV